MATKFAKISTQADGFIKKCSQIDAYLNCQNELIHKLVNTFEDHSQIILQIGHQIQGTGHQSYLLLIQEGNKMKQESKKFRGYWNNLNDNNEEYASDNLCKVSTQELKSKTQQTEPTYMSKKIQDLCAHVNNYHLFVSRITQVKQGEQKQTTIIDGQLLNNLIRWAQGLNFCVKMNQLINDQSEMCAKTVSLESEDQMGNLNLPEETIKAMEQNQSEGVYGILEKMQKQKKKQSQYQHKQKGEQNEKRAQTGHGMRSQMGS